MHTIPQRPINTGMITILNMFTYGKGGPRKRNPFKGRTTVEKVESEIGPILDEFHIGEAYITYQGVGSTSVKNPDWFQIVYNLGEGASWDDIDRFDGYIRQRYNGQAVPIYAGTNSQMICDARSYGIGIRRPISA